MHTLELTAPHSLGLSGTLLPGRYLADDSFAGSVLASATPGTCRLVGGDWPARPVGAFNGTRMILARPGGWGDLLFLTPAARELCRRGYRVEISCLAPYRPLFEGLSFVSRILPYPIPCDEIGGADVVPLERVLETDPGVKVKHAVDCVADRIGVRLSDHAMSYALRPEETAAAWRRFPRPKAKRLAVQVKASARCRSYPLPLLVQVLTLLHARGWHAFLLGFPGEVLAPDKPGLTNCAKRGLSFRESVAVMSTCDALLAPDSALMHVAGALGLPCAALFGPMPAAIRTGYSPTTEAINGRLLTEILTTGQ